MSFKKQDIYKALETITAPGEGKSLVENENITNIVTFGKEVIIDSLKLQQGGIYHKTILCVT